MIVLVLNPASEKIKVANVDMKRARDAQDMEVDIVRAPSLDWLSERYLELFKRRRGDLVGVPDEQGRRDAGCDEDNSRCAPARSGKVFATQQSPPGIADGRESGDTENSLTGTPLGVRGRDGRSDSCDGDRTSEDDTAQREKQCVVEVETSSAGQNFQCTVCHALFTRRWHAEDHVRRMHLGYRPFKCGECGTKFKQKSSRDSHVNAVHRKLRPFVCRVCNKAFGKKNNMKVHLVDVHGEKGLEPD